MPTLSKSNGDRSIWRQALRQYAIAATNLSSSPRFEMQLPVDCGLGPRLLLAGLVDGTSTLFSRRRSRGHPGTSEDVD